VVKAHYLVVTRLADSELNQQGVTQASAYQISSVKIAAAELLSRGGSDLMEGMQAVINSLG